MEVGGSRAASGPLRRIGFGEGCAEWEVVSESRWSGRDMSAYR